ncbi:MAG: transporter substrate-binding domain-containing protein [Alphaproteobacteria bacterium]|nr:MAG: transporter substrate-binding domain-containing protein [Alphaproteobacteria bacterium]
MKFKSDAMSRFLVLALMCFWAIPAHAACSKTLTFATLDYPPYVHWEKDGSATGLDADILAAVMKRAGCTYQFQQMPFKRALRAVAYGNLDGMPAVSFTKDRAAQAHFSLPIRHEVIAAFVRSEDTADARINSLPALVRSGRKVGYVLGGWHGEEFDAAIAGNAHFRDRLSAADEFLTLFRWLDSGLIDVAVVDLLIGQQMARDHADLRPMQALSFPVNVDTLHIMLSNKTTSDADIAALNRAVLDFQASPDYLALLRTHAPDDMVSVMAVQR